MTETPTATHQPVQTEMPFAVVQGTPMTELPKDLYIPPDALEVILEAFEGPLDLLLYLIKRQNLDILDIPIAHVTRQYMSYIELMQEMKFELAAEYLVMAAMLAEIKSRMLLPRPPSADEDEELDPRAELVRRLQEYERYKSAAEDLDALPRLERELHEATIAYEHRGPAQKEPEVPLDAVLDAFRDVLRRAEMFSNHRVLREPLSVRDRMTRILDHAGRGRFSKFGEFFTLSEGKSGVVVALIAILELLRNGLIELSQDDHNGPIYVRLAGPGAVLTPVA